MESSEAGELCKQMPNFEGCSKAIPRMRSYRRDLCRKSGLLIMHCKIILAVLWIPHGQGAILERGKLIERMVYFNNW